MVIRTIRSTFTLTFIVCGINGMERSSIQETSHSQGQYVRSVSCHNSNHIPMIKSALLEMLCYAYGPGDGLSTGHNNAIGVGDL